MGGGEFHPSGGVGMTPKGGLITPSEGGAVHCLKQQNQKNSKENTKTHPKDVADRPPWGVMHPRVRITGWKGQRGELGREAKHEQVRRWRYETQACQNGAKGPWTRQTASKGM